VAGGTARPHLWIVRQTIADSAGLSNGGYPGVAAVPARRAGPAGTAWCDHGPMPFLPGAAGQVFYRTWNCTEPGGAAGVAVLLHGLGQHSADYHGFARLLNGRGLDVWALDHVGHGMTEGEPGRLGPMPDLVENARRLVDRAGGGVGRPVLIGHSLGAVVAAALTLEHPGLCAGLVLTGAPLGAPGRARTPRPGDDAPEARARRRAVEAVRSGLAGGAPVPMLVLHGADDRIVPAESVVRGFGGCADVRLMLFDDAGHDLAHEPVRERVADAVAAFAAERRDLR